jgi:TrmH family RNA methyltransferase
MATPQKLAPATRATRGSVALLTSRDNRWLKEFRMALRGGLPTDSGAVGVEGVRLVEEALRSGCRIEAALFSESGERHRERLAPLIDRPEITFPVLRTTDRHFEGIADTEHPQGVAALVYPRAVALDDLLGAPAEACAPLLIVLVGVQDPGNVGTILRTASAFGATGAVTTSSGQSGSASPFSPKALRASAGAALHLPILAGMSLPILLTQLRIANVRTLASVVGPHHTVLRPGFVVARQAAPSADAVLGAHFSPPAVASALQSVGARHLSGSGPGAMSCSDSPLLAPWQIDWLQPIALLIGNEGGGLPEEIERGADARVHIPMAGGVESLNAAAAAAVLFYEAARQRQSLAAANTRKIELNP